jgi:hypothetical protein
VIGGGGQSNVANTLGSAAASAGLISPADVHPAQLKTFLRELPVAEIVAHRALAALRREFIQAGWRDIPLAVGVYRRAMGTGSGLATFMRPVYATADGVSIWPDKVRLPDVLLPLLKIDGVDRTAASGLAGSTDVQGKLEKLVPQEYGSCEAILTDSDQDSFEYHQIIDANEAFVVSQARGSAASVIPERAPMAVAETMLALGFTDAHMPTLPEARRMLISARWSGPLKPLSYDTVVVTYLLAEARYCVTDHRLPDAGFTVGEVVFGILT